MFIFLNVPITGRNYNREKQFSERKQMHIWCPSTTFQQHSMLGLCHIPSIGSGPLMAHLKGYIFSRLYFINGHHWTLWKSCRGLQIIHFFSERPALAVAGDCFAHLIFCSLCHKISPNAYFEYKIQGDCMVFKALYSPNSWFSPT